MVRGLAFMKDLLGEWLLQAEDLSLGIIGLEENGNVFYINKLAGSLLGSQPSHVLGKPVKSASPEYPIMEIFQTGKPKNTTRCLFRDRMFRMCLVPVRVRGKVIAAIGFIEGEAEKTEAGESRSEIGGRRICKQAAHDQYTFENIIGNSEPILKAKKQVIQAADSNSTVLLLGETGTGKELFAQAIHRLSRRRNGPFIQVNCAGIPESLMESELFGYEEGSFSGARKGGKPGKFELADRGTLFLDEVGDMSMAMQAKLLRILQDHKVERLGGTRSTKVDIRVIAATNKDLGNMVRSSLFREDLYYRLDVFTIAIPPLRDRVEDIAPLVDHFLPRIRKYINSSVTQVSREVLNLFLGYSWPGNVRELQNVIEGAMNLCTGHTIAVEDLNVRIKRELSHAKSIAPKPETSALKGTNLKTLERGMILKVLHVNNGNKRRAAQHLGIPRSTLYNKMKRYAINI